MPQDSQQFIPVAPDLNAWVRLMFQSFSANINCHTLGTINTFDPVTQTATIAINYLRVYKNANPNLPNPAPDGQTSSVYSNYPILIQCPVVVMQGGGAYLTFPIKPGDTCLVLFNDRELTTWLNTGQITYPQNQRVHDLSDGIALIGIRNTTSPIPSYDPNNATFSFPTGIINIVDKTGEIANKSGFMQVYPGATAPSGWLICDGSAISRTTYDSLFSICGTTYGVGNGTTTFNIPDMRGQIAVGIGGTLGLSLGQEFGEVTHTLTVPEVPALKYTAQPYYGGDPGAGASGFHPDGGNNTTGSPQTLTTTGGGGAHNNIQPSLGVNWIIKI